MMRFFLFRSFFPAVALIAPLMFLQTTARAKAHAYPSPGVVANRLDPRPGDDDKWAFTPFKPTYEERRTAYLQRMAGKGINDFYGAAAHVALGNPPAEMPETTIAYYVKDIGAREDCADFTAIRIISALNFNKRNKFLTDEQAARLRDALLNFKYWIDEPGPDTMISWTENHQILFHTTEYLAGQMFPDAVFTNNGKTGAEHREHARKLLLKWLERRARWGFSEWDSDVYYSEDIAGIAALAEFADDPDVASAAAIVLDEILLDVALDLFYGMPATSHGRAYDQDILSGREHSITDLIKMIWGLGQFTGYGEMGASVIALAQKYRPPEAIIAIGSSNSAPLLSFERHGIPFEAYKQYGLDPKSLDDIVTFWGMGAYSQREVLDTFFVAADTWNLWGHPFFDIIGEARKNIPRNGKLGEMFRSITIESDRILLGEANKIMFRTPDYALSSAVDYRPGEGANQHHIWQATLSPEAIVFTTNPGSLEINSDRTPDLWAGQNRLPRVAQYRNIAFIIYNIDTRKAMGERTVYEWTHAFFPRWAFEETAESGGWLFGRVGDGYVALYSAQPYTWTNPQDTFAHEVIAQGRRNIWICLMGSRKDNGTFEEFRNAILASPPDVDLEKLTVAFNAPGVGLMGFAWKGPFIAGGQPMPLSGFKLFDSPYAVSEFDSGRFDIHAGGHTLLLDFTARTITEQPR